MTGRTLYTYRSQIKSQNAFIFMCDILSHGAALTEELRTELHMEYSTNLGLDIRPSPEHQRRVPHSARLIGHKAMSY